MRRSLRRLTSHAGSIRRLRDEAPAARALVAFAAGAGWIVCSWSGGDCRGWVDDKPGTGRSPIAVEGPGMNGAVRLTVSRRRLRRSSPTRSSGRAFFASRAGPAAPGTPNRCTSDRRSIWTRRPRPGSSSSRSGVVPAATRQDRERRVWPAPFGSIVGWSLPLMGDAGRPIAGDFDATSL